MKDVPADYYVRLHAVEEGHWWHLGMREITEALLRDRLGAGDLSLLDAGCGAGGFLAWASGTGSFHRLCGLDVSAEAIDLARRAVPAAQLRVAPVDAIPFADGSFDVAVLNDVLQHVDESAIQKSLGELARVVRDAGTLLVRTNGGRRARRERADWRLYDDDTLRAELERGGFRVDRVTHANTVLSAWGAVRGRAPQAPTGTSCGIPSAPGPLANAVGSALLRLEARYLAANGRRLPYGHTLLAVATRR